MVAMTGELGIGCFHLCTQRSRRTSGLGELSPARVRSLGICGQSGVEVLVLTTLSERSDDSERSEHVN